jgi:hypothetical protein
MQHIFPFLSPGGKPETLRAMLPRFAAACLIVGLFLAGCGRDEPYQRTSPLPHEAFVWQRVWTPEVRAAVEGAEMEKLHVLAAEVRFEGKRTVETRIAVPWPALNRFRDRLGVVIRIHASAAATKWDSDACDMVLHLARSILTQANEAGLGPAEYQIDYDCPVSKLNDYTKLLKHLRSRLPPETVRITALPAWLADVHAPELLHLSPGYVLQVHSLHLPRDGRLTGLIDYDEARSAISRAVEIGVPFRVALPTYSCVVEFADDGRVKDVHGEDIPAGFSLASDRHAVLDSDAYALAGLVIEWQRHASEKLQSVIWYRLPVSTDRLNWPAEVLPKIMRGEQLKRGWSVQLEPSPEGHQEVVLLQQGDAPDDLPRQIQITHTEAADGLRGYVVEGQPPGTIVLRLASPSRFGRVRPGGKITAGWIRSGGQSEARILR